MPILDASVMEYSACVNNSQNQTQGRADCRGDGGLGLLF